MSHGGNPKVFKTNRKFSGIGARNTCVSTTEKRSNGLEGPAIPTGLHVSTVWPDGEKLQQKHEISSNLLKEEWGSIMCVGENPAFYDFYFQACLKGNSVTTDLALNQRQYKMISILRVEANRRWGMNIKVPGQWLSFSSILSNFHESQYHLRWMKHRCTIQIIWIIEFNRSKDSDDNWFLYLTLGL